MNKQPEALRLASFMAARDNDTVALKSADELRRLNSINSELLEALHKLIDVTDLYVPFSAQQQIAVARAAILKATGEAA